MVASPPRAGLSRRSRPLPRLHDRSRAVTFAGALLTTALSLTALSLTAPALLTAQTITGTLLDSETDRPIQLGLVMMFTTEGDSITATVTDEVGRFRLRSPDPGDFVLLAAALGYKETPAGVFELGRDGELHIEYRIASEPLPLDAVIVSLDRPVLDHHLVRNGFVRRFQRGLGFFITPYMIERSPARSTESLLEGMPQVRVGPVSAPVQGLGLPMPHLGEAIQVMGPTGGWCHPQVYVDGMPMRYDPSMGFTVSQVAPLHTVEAIEVYRRAAEIPVEFAPGTQDVMMTGQEYFSGSGPQTGCGMILVWTKLGLAAGQRPGFGRDPRTGLVRGLPEVRQRGPAPVTGERVRFEISEREAQARGLPTPWEGTLELLDDLRIVAIDERSGMPVMLPLDAISNLQVSRRKGPADAWKRGLIGGAALGVGTWGFLELLCAYTCGATAEQETVIPGLIVGVLSGALLVSRGPGNEWVRPTTLGAGPGPEPGSVSLSLSLRH